MKIRNGSDIHFLGRVPCACASGSGYPLVETWHATSVLHSLRSLRAFRCYPSREYACMHIRTHTNCVRHAEGMRQHGANSTEAIA